MIMYCIVVCFTAFCDASYFRSWQADKAYAAGDFARARTLYQEAVEKNPQDLKALYNVGKAAFKAEDYASAAQAFEKVGTTALTAQEKEQAFFNQGDSFAKLSQYEKAVNAYKEALKINPSNEHIKQRLALMEKLLQEQKKKEEEEKKKKEEQDKKEKEQKQEKEKQEKNKQGEQKEQKQSSQQEESDKKKKQDKEQTRGQDSQKEREQEKQRKQEQTQQSEQKASDDQAAQEKDRAQTGKQSGSQSAEQTRKEEAEKEQQGKHSQPSQQEMQKKESAALTSQQTRKSIADERLNVLEKKVLEAAEQEDTQMYKALVKTQIQAKMPANYGQKNW